MTFDRRITPFRPDLADESLRGKVEAERFACGALKRIMAHCISLHRQPSHDAPIDTQAIFGETVRVYDEHDGWAWVQLQNDSYVGYVPSAVLGAADIEPTHRVGAIRTFVYPGPSLKLPLSGHLPLNALVSVVKQEGDYAELATGGFVFAPHIVGLDAKEPDFVSVAERFLHIPYLWGGKSSLGLDCSGLAQTALRAAGIAALRDSDMQEEQLGTPVEIRPDLGGLKRGDLVFWKGHVGMMQDETRLLHATGFTMTVYSESLRVADQRILSCEGKLITSIKRLPSLGG
ncbi:C40 family peptidase [Microvirga flavescens]|uniref:C40 family peptidase n=1 Tax=Microvirga flavescens TaxID=2249811 RepID=UPI000DD6A9CD|nr:NlpC/P60 family protein [Microvirga flavescens]